MRTNSVSLAAYALAASACAATAAHAGMSADGPPMRVVSVLDCPADQGSLTRMAQAADGRSCDYQGRAGETVRLRLVPLQGRAPAEALASTRAEMHALLPVYDEPVRAFDPDEPGDRADVDLPFIHVHSVGDRADVRLFGIRISSDGRRNAADVDISHGHKRSIVHAGARGAEVTAEDVGRTNASLVYVLAANRRGPFGYRAVGYVAKGPVTGPLVVAEFRSTRDRHEVHDVDHGDIGHLVERNVGR